MSNSKEARIDVIVGMIAVNHGKVADDPMLDLWQLALKNMPIEQIEKGFVKSLSIPSSFMPTTGRFIELCTTEGANSKEAQAAIAWAEVVVAIKRHGHASTVCFKDPTTGNAVSKMGGWKWLCMNLKDAGENMNIPFEEKRFIGLYMTELDHGNDTPLILNRGNGYIQWVGNFKGQEKKSVVDHHDKQSILEQAYAHRAQLEN